MKIRFAAALLFCGAVAALADASQQRDTPLTPVSGSASITGQLLTDETTPRPIRRAIVTVSGDLPAASSAITDDEGRFTFRNLPAGRFTINATKIAYLPASYGALRPGRPGTPLQIATGEQAAVTIKMARGGVIAGTIRDRNGAPISGIPVTAAPARSLTGNASSGSAGNTSPELTTMTDDRGMYRLFGLAGGEYVISATPRIGGSGAIGTRSAAEIDALFAELMTRGRGSSGASRTAPSPSQAPPPISDPPSVGFAATYYPGTPLPQEAVPVKVSVAEERAGMDFAVVPVRTSILEGSVTGPVANLAVVQLSIVITGRRSVSSSDLNPIMSLPPGADGRFKYTNVSPGRYTIMARANRNQTAPAAPPTGGGASTGVAAPAATGSGRADYLYAVADLDIRGEDMTGLNLALQPGSTFAGRVRFEGTTLAPPKDLTTVRLSLFPPGGTLYMTSGNTIIGNTFSAVPAFATNQDGSFAASNIAPGVYTFNATLPAELGQGWWLRSAMTKDRDLLDGPLAFQPGENFSDVVLTFSDQHSELSGALQSLAGVAAPEYFVVVFPEDRALWLPNGRRTRSTRPATNGKFSVRDLPAGDYLMAALIDLDPGDLNDPKFLEALVSSAVRVQLADGEKKQQDLRVAR